MASITPTSNNTNECMSCKSNITEGIIRNGAVYCNTICFTKATAPSTPMHPYYRNMKTPTGRTGGTCAACTNKYGYCIDCVDDGTNWFCGKTCQTMYNTAMRVQKMRPQGGITFASNLYTVFPLAVNSSNGKMYF